MRAVAVRYVVFSLRAGFALRLAVLATRPWMFGTLVVLRIVTSLVDVAVPFAAGHLIDTVATAEGHDLRSAVHALGGAPIKVDHIRKRRSSLHIRRV